MIEKTLACCYTRFSTDHQNQSSTIGQLKAIKAYCEKNNIEIIETYIDEAQTGTNLNRKDFQRLLADAPNALWDTVVVYNMSRLSRSVKDTLNIKDEFEKLGKKIISVIENQDETPEGDFFNLITYGMNELFVKQFARDSWRGLMVNANECKALGGTPLYGYKIGNDRKYEINPEEAEIVKMIFEMVAKGHSYKYIAEYLNNNGYSRRHGKPFTSNFTDMLRNEKYKGNYVWNLRENKKKVGKKNNRIYKDDAEVVRITGGVPAIIDNDLFNKIQKILDERIIKYKKRGPKSKYLLSGLIRCGYCEHAFNGGYTHSGRGQLFRALYECNNRIEGKRKCKSKDINMEYMDWYIRTLLLETILNHNSIKIYQLGLKELCSFKRRALEIKLNDIKLEKSEVKRKSLEYAELLQFASETEYINLMKQISLLSSKRAQLELEELDINRRLSYLPRFTIKDIQSFISKYRKLIASKDKEIVRKTMFHLIDKIVIDNDEIKVNIDLMKCFNIPKINGESPLIVIIVEDRSMVANKPNHSKIDFTGAKLKASFERLKSF